MASSLIIEENQGILSVGLNRPAKRNALNGELVQALLETLHNTNQDAHIRVLILHGIGEHFCAGADIHWMYEMSQGSWENNIHDAKQLSLLLYQLHHFSKPTITVAQGTTLGGGLGLLATSDMVLAAENASFEFSEIKMGLVPFVISPYIISIMGERTSRYYFLTGERFNSHTAMRLGLIHQIIHHDPLTAAHTLARTLLQYEITTVFETKKWLKKVSQTPLTPELAEQTAEALARLRISPATQTGLQTFLERKTKVKNK
jgi:methylglutaconyl-CoA hydratase